MRVKILYLIYIILYGPLWVSHGHDNRHNINIIFCLYYMGTNIKNLFIIVAMGQYVDTWWGLLFYRTASRYGPADPMGPWNKVYSINRPSPDASRVRHDRRSPRRGTTRLRSCSAFLPLSRPITEDAFPKSVTRHPRPSATFNMSTLL